MQTDLPLYHGMSAMLVGLLCVGALWIVHRVLRESRPGFEIWRLIGLALAARLGAIGVTEAFGLGDRIRSTDDADFLTKALDLAQSPLVDADWLRTAVGELPIIPWALIVKVLGDPGEISLRVFQISLETVGLVLFAALTYDLAGGRAARICMWILALEPSNVFFATLLHDEALATVAAGAFLLGLRRVWVPDTAEHAVGWMSAGLLLALGTRPYIGGAMVLALAATLVHRRLRVHLDPRRAALIMLATIALGTPVAFALATTASPGALQSLQREHDVNYEFANLDLGDVDVTTTGGLVETLAFRSVDLFTRPLPWQLENTSQQLGALATCLWYLLIASVVVLALRARDALPRGWLALVYCFMFQAAGFALTLVNAALGFRHRIHLMMIAACLLAALLVLRRERTSDATRSPIAS